MINFYLSLNDIFLSPLYFVFGKDFYKMNLRKRDVEINKECAMIRESLIKIVESEVEKLKNDKQNTIKYISIVKLLFDKDLLKLEDEKCKEQLLSEIFIFLVAGKDTTKNFL